MIIIEIMMTILISIQLHYNNRPLYNMGTLQLASLVSQDKNITVVIAGAPDFRVRGSWAQAKS